jgi:hypothetical protein
MIFPQENRLKTDVITMPVLQAIIGKAMVVRFHAHTGERFQSTLLA